MRIVVFALSALFTVGIFVTMLVSIWSTRDRVETRLRPGQSLAGELVWAAIPCLMIVAAAIPAGVAILTRSSTVPREPSPLSISLRVSSDGGEAQDRSARCGSAVVESVRCLPVRLRRTRARQTSLELGEHRRHEIDSSERAQTENGAKSSNRPALVGQSVA